jgi:hypothetical protein
VEAVGRVVGIVLIVGLACASCGSNDNDQGITFRAVGIFQGERQQEQCEVPTTDNQITDASVVLPLESQFVDGGYPDSTSLLSFCRGFLELENNLNNQAITVNRVDFRYEIPGSRVAIPASSALVGWRLNPANADPDTNPNSFGQVNVIFAQLDGQLVPSTLVSFLRQNQPSLPKLPYNMIIRLTAQGRSDSGDLIETNEISYSVQWTGQ